MINRRNDVTINNNSRETYGNNRVTKGSAT